jgi:hypothetical protein
MKSLLTALVVAALAFGGQAAHAQRAGKPLPKGGGFMAQMDMEFGGDKILTVDFEDGDSQDIRAGQGLALDVGGWFRPSETVPIEIAGTIGYKFVTTAADNADINLSRTVVKLNATYWFQNSWFATAGLTHHMNPKLDGDGFFEDITFDDATGFSAEVGWRWIALRYTKLTYELPGFEDIDASSVGLTMTFRFGGRRGGY